MPSRGRERAKRARRTYMRCNNKKIGDWICAFESESASRIVSGIGGVGCRRLFGGSFGQGSDRGRDLPGLYHRGVFTDRLVRPDQYGFRRIAVAARRYPMSPDTARFMTPASRPARDIPT